MLREEINVAECLFSKMQSERSPSFEFLQLDMALYEFLLQFLCPLGSIAAHVDHCAQCLSVCLSVCPVVILSW